MLWPALENSFRAAISDCVTTEDVHKELLVQPLLRRFSTPWRPPEVQPLPASDPVSADAADQEQEVEFYWVGTEARIAGTVVHRWLQVLAEQRIDGDPCDPALRSAVTTRWLKELGIGEPMRDGIARRVSVALDGILGDDTGRWLLAGDGHAELALSGIYEGRLESVVLDRVRIDESGDHWIVDYKTSSHEGGNLEGFIDAEIARYTPQLEKYAAIYAAFSGIKARRALYFPLLRRLVELQ
jgi:hypothetical protein